MPMKDNALLKENAELKQTIASLKDEIVSLKQKIVTLQQEATESKNQPITPRNKLSDEAEKILMFLTEHREVTSKQVAHYVFLDFTTTDYWLKELVRDRMVHAAISIKTPTKYSIGQGGRDYLINNNMI